MHSPQSSCANPENSRSPHNRQRSPEMGSRDSRHSGQTGNRELTARGRPHRRQSEGNRRVTTQSSVARTPLLTADSRRRKRASRTRVRSPLLLKTILLNRFSIDLCCARRQSLSQKFHIPGNREWGKGKRNLIASSTEMVRRTWICEKRR